MISTHSAATCLASRESPARGFPRFDTPVPINGYHWWYLDALSDDGRQGLTLIAFIGSVFSPYYAAARRTGPGADPREHVAINLALYGSRRRWALAERGAAALRADPAALHIGRSHLEWQGGTLVARIDERSAPWRQALRGELRIHPEALTDHEFELAAAGDHRWWPVAPASRIEVRMQEPALAWSGRGYLDSNRGAGPLENAFRSWTWSRAQTPSGTRIYYDLACRDGSHRQIAALVRPDGEVEQVTGPPPAPLAPTLVWRIPRAVRDEAGQARVVRTLEDTPFYARSVVAARQGGLAVTAVHESLSLDRFARGWVQRLIPYRMSREAGPAEPRSPADPG